MSVTFSIEGQRPDYDDPSTFVNLSNVNAADLLEWLALPRDLWGQIDARELAARCRRRLWDVPRNHDPGRAPIVQGRLVTCGRFAGYLRERTADILRLAERAGAARIHWS
jgi:hypothetical protein